MSIATGGGKMGRSTRAGSTRPGRLGGAIKAGARMLRGARGRGGRRHRRRGISAAELRGFRKINRLLHSIGMRPKSTHKARR